MRDDEHLSQTEFALRVGSSQSAFATYERGLREPPVAIVSAVCKEFNVDPRWLLFGEGGKYTRDAAELAARAYRVTRQFVLNNAVDWTEERENEFFILSFRYLSEHVNASDEFLHFMLGRAGVK